MIPESEWTWHGTPGHLIVAYSCCFRLHTTVGTHRISTVGCYHPSEDPRRAQPPREVGYGRLYETMVFTLGADGEPAEWCEVDSDGYNDEASAVSGHRAMCEKWAATEVPVLP